MKKINKFLSILIFAIVSISLFLISSCDKMDDIQKEYAEKEEQVYLGKVDSIRSIPGIGKVKLTWYISADPKIEQTVIYWNLRQDSLVKDFVRNTSGVQKDSLVLENLEEGTLLVEFRNKNKRGETSLFTSINAKINGPKYLNTLKYRRITSTVYDYDGSLFNLTLASVNPSDNVVYAMIEYKDTNGKTNKVKVENDSLKVELANYPDGETLKMQTVFFQPGGIDSIYSNFYEVASPKAMIGKGKKISLTGDIENTYFERDGKQLYEWNSNGDLTVYDLNADDSFTQTEWYPEIVPRTQFREFFFYNDDKFIGINTSNAVSMHQINNGELALIRTSTGAETFGTGYSFQRFLPAGWYFISMAAGTGELKSWLAQNDASWGTPNGSTIGTGYAIYDPLILYNAEALLGVDEEGILWNTPVSVAGTLGAKTQIGSGWERFKKIFSVGTKLFGMEENGDIYAFDFNPNGFYWKVD